jgi:P27 family predicted phage terminase small subunit
MLDELGVLSVVDPEPIEQYARVYELWRKAESRIKKGGRRGGCFTTDGGRVKAPARFFKDLAMVLVRIEVELGLTPSARTRLKAEPGDSGPQGKLAKYG